MYTGNGNQDTAITNTGNSNLKPDFLWIKSRSLSQSNAVFDSTRGPTKRLVTNSSAEQTTENTNVDSFDTDGFTVDQEAIVNQASATYVAWQWKANGGTTASNGNGSITSTVQADTTAGFSIVSYTGTGSNATIGHGLSTVPTMIWVKRLSGGTRHWAVYHSAMGSSKELYLDLTQAQTASDFWQTTPTSSVFSVSTSNYVNNNGDPYIAYLWSDIKGYCASGYYVGRNTATFGEAPYIETGFRPGVIIVKNWSSVSDWQILDTRRRGDPGWNNNLYRLKINSNQVEDTQVDVNIYSSGFSVNTTSTDWNASGDNYMWMAWSDQAFVSNAGVPGLAF